jgi:hypothetical protein
MTCVSVQFRIGRSIPSSVTDPLVPRLVPRISICSFDALGRAATMAGGRTATLISCARSGTPRIINVQNNNSLTDRVSMFV